MASTAASLVAPPVRRCVCSPCGKGGRGIGCEYVELLSGAVGSAGRGGAGRGRRGGRVCARTSVYVVNHGEGHGWGCGSLSSVVGGLPG